MTTRAALLRARVVLPTLVSPRVSCRLRRAWIVPRRVLLPVDRVVPLPRTEGGRRCAGHGDEILVGRRPGGDSTGWCVSLSPLRFDRLHGGKRTTDRTINRKNVPKRPSEMNERASLSASTEGSVE